MTADHERGARAARGPSMNDDARLEHLRRFLERAFDRPSEYLQETQSRQRNHRKDQHDDHRPDQHHNGRHPD